MSLLHDPEPTRLPHGSSGRDMSLCSRMMRCRHCRKNRVAVWIQSSLYQSIGFSLRSSLRERSEQASIGYTEKWVEQYCPGVFQTEARLQSIVRGLRAYPTE